MAINQFTENIQEPRKTFWFYGLAVNALWSYFKKAVQAAMLSYLQEHSTTANDKFDHFIAFTFVFTEKLHPFPLSKSNFYFWSFL